MLPRAPHRDGAARRRRGGAPRAGRDRRVPAADRARSHRCAHRSGEPPAGHIAHGCGDRGVARAARIESAGGTVTVPTWRPDIEREIDIVEEVARRIGLQRITRSIPSSPEKIGALTAVQRERRKLGDVLVGAGYDEAFTLPLLAPSDLARAGLDTEALIEVENPLRAEESILRPALLPGVLRAVAHNAAHGNHDVSLFELGHVFGPPAPGATLPVERLHVAAARARQDRPGPVRARSRRHGPRSRRGRRSARARVAVGRLEFGRRVAARVPSRTQRREW